MELCIRITTTANTLACSLEETKRRRTRIPLWFCPKVTFVCLATILLITTRTTLALTISPSPLLRYRSKTLWVPVRSLPSQYWLPKRPVSPSFHCVRLPLSHLCSTTDSINKEDEYDEWSATNVEHDLQKLRLSIAESNAQNDLEHKRRMDLLDEFARRRRPLLPDL